MQVINLNRKGEVIDLSTITLSKDLSERIHQILNRSVPREQTKNDSEQRKC